MDKYVSVIIPTYKRADYLDRAINSVLSQDYPYIEIIVVDDNGVGSDEQVKTEQVVQKYKKLRNFKYLAHIKNINGSAARNTGIRNSMGDYICFLDDDDSFFSHKITEQIKLLKSLDNIWGACYTGHARVYPTGARFEYNAKKQGDLAFDILASKVDLCAGSTLMIRREVIENVGYFDEEFTRYQDIEYTLRIANLYKIAAVENTCVEIYVHQGSNIPKSASEYQQRKKEFLNKFLPEICKLPKKQRAYVEYVHAIDISKQYIKEKNLIRAFGIILNTNYPLFAFFKIISDVLKYILKLNRIRVGI